MLWIIPHDMKLRTLPESNDPEKVLQCKRVYYVGLLIKMSDAYTLNGLFAQIIKRKIVMLCFPAFVMLLPSYFIPCHVSIFHKLLKDLSVFEIRAGEVESKFSRAVYQIESPYGFLLYCAARPRNNNFFPPFSHHRLP